MLRRTGQIGRGAQMTLPLGDPQGERIVADEAPAWPSELSPVGSGSGKTAVVGPAPARDGGGGASRPKVSTIVALLRRTRQATVVFTE